MVSGSTGVLKQHAIDVEWVEVTVAEAVDRNGNVCDELGGFAS